MLKLIMYVLNYCAEFKQLLLEDFEVAIHKARKQNNSLKNKVK